MLYRDKKRTNCTGASWKPRQLQVDWLPHALYVVLFTSTKPQ
jgi:hypothetical protein